MVFYICWTETEELNQILSVFRYARTNLTSSLPVKRECMIKFLNVSMAVMSVLCIRETDGN